MEEQGRSFGPFQLYPARRLLLRHGQPVRLGSRALDLLITLTERPGEVIAKDELIARTWPGTFVEEANLRVHIGALRKALGDGQADGRFIANVPGRGYGFVAPVAGQTAAPLEEPLPAPAPAPAFPQSIIRVIGRDDVVQTVAALLQERRLVTIVGPGGMGKTTVALAVAESMAVNRRDAAVFVDLAPVTDPAAVPRVLASTLGLTDRSENLIGNVVAHLHERRPLIVLDNCEHLIDAAATLVETLLARALGATILATSREPLRVAGEWVQRLHPLDTPAPAAATTAAEAMTYPAVQLFVERASSCLGGYTLTDADAPVVGEICRRLDGIALAIELAAGHLDTIGVRGLAASLDDGFRVLTRGRRTALPRHQTLRATLDWSYRTLAPDGQSLLRRLSVFNGCFTLAVARAVVPGPGLTAEAVEEGLIDLVAKSLVAADVGEVTVHYRLLDTTRAYARDRLAESTEGEALRRRHALHYRALFERAEAEWETIPTGAWLAAYVRHIDNLRAALDWAFSPAGDAGIGVALTAAAVPFWFALLRLDECHARVQQALAVLATQPESSERQRMKLNAALGFPQMRAVAGLPSGAAAWRTTLAIAEALGDTDYQLRALWALWVDRTNSGEPAAALALAERFASLAPDAADRSVGDRMRARSLSFMGDQDAAHDTITAMLDHYVAPVNRAHTVRFQYDQRAVARVTLARVLWLRGFPEAALRTVEDTIASLEGGGHDLTLAHVYADAACPIALLSGDLDLAERWIGRLYELTKPASLDVWHTYADGFAGELALRRGAVEAGLARLRDVVERLEQTGFVLYRSAFLGTLADGQRLAGRPVEGLATVDAVLAECERSGEGWFTAELHRIRGELLLALGRDGAADEAFGRSLDVARRQNARGWERRTSGSLTRRQRRSPALGAERVCL